MRAAAVLSTIVLVTALSAACGEGTDPPSTRPAQERPGQDRAGRYDLVLEEASVRACRGRDRLVLRFAGTGRPGWHARYVDEAVLDGSGRVVALEGEAVLQLDISGTPTRVRRREVPVRGDLDGSVADVRTFGAFEGVTQVFVGLRDRRLPYRVVARTGPSRLVVDLGPRRSGDG